MRHPCSRYKVCQHPGELYIFLHKTHSNKRCKRGVAGIHMFKQKQQGQRFVLISFSKWNNLVSLIGCESRALHCCATARRKIWDTFHSIIWKWPRHWLGACLCGEKFILKNPQSNTITKSIYHNKVKEKGGTCRVLGCDGTGVNTGIHNGDEWKLLDYELKSGALRVIQLELGVECQQIVCQLHLNELFLRHRQVSFLLFGQL